MAGFAVLAPGGNALLREGGDVSVEAEQATLRSPAEQIAALTAPRRRWSAPSNVRDLFRGGGPGPREAGG
ncbi:MAG: hypothetical protein QN193_00460 [Armatimonadota bacterium]|nr:hypothetical protein [Armatimonadota bacterium]MDR7443767.1 hypothetical protein [Armatimonadota bacterium]MDR7569063.1 hypothetical protein [Armatimonadota bacterium]MDR7613952.1 hypothetical protein [Armatimonadota bacterium]